MAKFVERVFSGVQPTGNLHLGNYLGAITKFVELQKTHDCLYCVVDLHAITLPQKPEELKASIREVTAAFIACGIDPENTYCVQSEPGHRACRACLGVQLRGAHRLAQPHDSVQGKGRQGPRERLRRALCLSLPDGRRYSCLSRDSCPGWRGPESSILNLPATSRKNSISILPPRSRRSGYGDAFLPFAGAAHSRARHPRHESARWLQENVEVGPFRLFADQSVRRSRRDRAKGPQGEDRSRTRCPRKSKASSTGRKPTILSAFMPRSTARRSRMCCGFSAAAISPTFKSALVDLAVAKLGPIGAEMKRLKSRPRLYRPGSRRWRRPRPRDRGQEHGDGEGYFGFCA